MNIRVEVSQSVPVYNKVLPGSVATEYANLSMAGRGVGGSSSHRHGSRTGMRKQD